MKNQDPAKKQKRDIIITSILLVVFAVSFTKNVLLRKTKIPQYAAEISNDQTLSVSDQLVYVTNLRLMDQMRARQRAVWDKEWGRDPFVAQELASRNVKAVNLTLNAILWDEKHAKAIINEKMVVAGDTIYGYTVIEILPKSVILRTGEKNMELSVFRAVMPDLGMNPGLKKENG